MTPLQKVREALRQSRVLVEDIKIGFDPSEDMGEISALSEIQDEAIAQLDAIENGPIIADAPKLPDIEIPPGEVRYVPAPTEPVVDIYVGASNCTPWFAPIQPDENEAETDAINKAAETVGLNPFVFRAALLKYRLHYPSKDSLVDLQAGITAMRQVNEVEKKSLTYDDFWRDVAQACAEAWGLKWK